VARAAPACLRLISAKPVFRFENEPVRAALQGALQRMENEPGRRQAPVMQRAAMRCVKAFGTELPRQKPDIGPALRPMPMQDMRLETGNNLSDGGKNPEIAQSRQPAHRHAVK